MGFLTTITFLNDAAHNYEENPTRLVEIIHDAITGNECIRNGGRSYSEHIGNHCNPIRVQRTRHADNHTVYVHMGNTVTEVNPDCADTKDILERNPDYFDKQLAYLEQQVKALKKMRKEHREKKYNLSEEGLAILKRNLYSLKVDLRNDPNGKVKVIKEIRTATGYSLKEAIQFYESI